MTSIMILCKK